MSSYSIDNKRGHPAGYAADDAARSIFDALKGLRFCSVEIIVHEGQVVQLERREKVRFDKLKDAPQSNSSSVNRHVSETENKKLKG